MSTDSPDYMDDGFGDLGGMDAEAPAYVTPLVAGPANYSENVEVVSYSGAKDWFEKAYTVATETAAKIKQAEQATQDILTHRSSGYNAPVNTDQNSETPEPNKTLTYVAYGLGAVALGLAIAAAMGAFSSEND